MTKNEVRQDGDARWADLAELALVIAREIQFHGYSDARAIPLSQVEGTVMRYLHQNPAALPSRIAAATGLQRTNLSTALRDLERKGLVERRPSSEDGRKVIVHRTERGIGNYDLVRQEWAAAVSAAAGHDTGNIDAALALLTRVRDGLVGSRPHKR